jgi:hypothetical protein
MSVRLGLARDKKSLMRYISAGTQEIGQFVRDLGENWFDHDFIAVNYQKHPEPVEHVVSALAQSAADRNAACLLYALRTAAHAAKGWLILRCRQMCPFLRRGQHIRRAQ